MKFEPVEPMARVSAIEAIQTGGPTDRADALVALAYHDPDLEFVQDLCLQLLADDGDPSVQSTAALCLGHLARIHGRLDTTRAIPAIAAFAFGNPSLAGRAHDALDDIRMFTGDHR